MKKGLAPALAIGVAVAAVVIGCSSDGASDSPAAGTVVGEQSVGASGGTVSGGGVTLAIPPGALASDQKIRITRTDDTVPGGIVALGAIYRFEPDGLTFTAPVRATFTLSTPTPNAVVFWSSPSGYERRPTEVSGTQVAADIAHFSSGFVGQAAGDAGTDASPPDDAAPATDGATCSCAQALTCCGGSCVSTASDAKNCGGCGKACGAGQACIGSACAAGL
jgi:hypothetical protein